MTKLIAGLVVKNEEKRYLKMVLENLSLFCNEIIILDNGSIDKTIQLCESFPKVVKPVSNDGSVWHEAKLRSKLVNELIVPRNPDWICIMDADEVFENRIVGEIEQMMNQKDYFWFTFLMCHFWQSMEHYRVDGQWSARTLTEGRLFKHIGNKYWFPDKMWHCPNIPPQITSLPGIQHTIRIKHYGYAKKEDLDKKLKAYYSWVAQGVMEKHMIIL